MDVALTGDQELFRETTRRFVETESSLSVVRGWEADPAGFSAEFWRRGAELGWTSLLVSAEDGGGSISDNGLADLIIVAEEMGRLVAPGPLVPVNVVAAAVSAGGSAALRAAVLPCLLSGVDIGAWAVAEPGWRGDPALISCTARAAGDGFVLSGVKTAVEAGAQARWLLVAAVTADGPTQFLVASDAPGVEVTEVGSMDLVRRFAEVRLTDVQVPAGNVVGSVGDAADDLARQLRIAAVVQCAETCGALQRVFEFTLEYLADRYSFGRPLASYQALKHRAADMKLALESCHAITIAAARSVGEDRPDARELASAAKVYVGRTATEMVQDCVQLHGGIGVTWEHDLHLYLRRVSVNRSTYGSVTDHREQVASALAMSQGAGR